MECLREQMIPAQEIPRKTPENNSRRGEQSQNYGEQQKLLGYVTHSMDSMYLYKSSHKTSKPGIHKPAYTASPWKIAMNICHT